MPRIGGGGLAAHSDLVWASVLDGIERLLSQRPLDEISIADIAAEAGLARNTLYNYAPDKRALVTRAAEMAAASFYVYLEDLVPEGTSPRDKIASLTHGILYWFGHGKHRFLVAQVLFRQSGLHKPNDPVEALTPLLQRVATIVSEGIEIGQFASSQDVCWTVYLMASAIDPAVRQVLAAPETASWLTDGVTTFLLRSLGSN